MLTRPATASAHGTSFTRFFPFWPFAVPHIIGQWFAERDGSLGRYALRAPGARNLDLSLAKNFAISERLRVQLRGDALNALNHTNLSGLVVDISKSNFGALTSATARAVQIGAKVIF